MKNPTLPDDAGKPDDPTLADAAQRLVLTARTWGGRSHVRVFDHATSQLLTLDAARRTFGAAVVRAVASTICGEVAA